jgi:hypothetical protein
MVFTFQNSGRNVQLNYLTENHVVPNNLNYLHPDKMTDRQHVAGRERSLQRGSFQPPKKFSNISPAPVLDCTGVPLLFFVLF